MTARDVWLLAMLDEHTVLTTEQLLRLGWARSRRAVQARTRTLYVAGLLDRFRPLAPPGQGTMALHLVLAPDGADALAAHGPSTSGPRRRPAPARVIARRQALNHDLGVTDLAANLAGAAGIRLERWWSEARCARLFGTHVRPDAYLSLTTLDPRTHPDLEQAETSGAGGERWWEMFLEYDTGTETLARLAGKVTGYHALAAATGVVTPVAVWITRTGREPTARRALAAALTALPRPALVPLLTGAPHPTPTSPARPGTASEPVWLPVRADAHARVNLSALATHRGPPNPADTPDNEQAVALGAAPAPRPPAIPPTERPR